MTSEQIKQLDAEYLLPTYARFNLALSKGQGCTAWDPEGNEYLDFTSGIGVNSLGFCDPEWAGAVAGQAATLQHTSNLYYTQPGTELAQMLCQRTGMARVFFSNSGAEANEGAIKTVRKYSSDKYGPGRHNILVLENSFHGRTLAALAATGQEVFHRHFHPFPEGFRHIPANNTAVLEAEAAKGDVCAIMLEAVQGEGGVLPLDTTYVQAAEALCRRHDLLLVMDEVQTGIGRTGSLFAWQQMGVKPDVVSFAKGVGGGLPLGGFLMANSCAQVLGKGDHGTTFGANPVCCAGALVVLKRLDDAFLAHVAAKAQKLRAGLLALPGVAEVYGMGLMLGVEFSAGIAAADVAKAAMEKGLLCLTAKTRLRLLPPLVISEEDIDKGLAILNTVLDELK